MGPRSVGRTAEEIAFDEEAEEQSEVRCINVSPFPARFEIATVPGSKPRRHKLSPGGSVYLQHGYTVPFLGASRKIVQPTIESLTEREAWPGKRGPDSDGKIVWQVKPGPRLPMVVSEDRAASVKAQWDAAMASKDEALNAPLRMTLQRADGTQVQVDAEIAPSPVPLRGRKPVPVVDEEDQEGELDEPPPDIDDPIAPGEVAPVTLPKAQTASGSPLSAPTPVAPKTTVTPKPGNGRKD